MAAGPGGKEVGRVSIRVVPDTSKFRRELREQLSRLGDSVEVPVTPKVDTSGVSRARRELQNAFRDVDVDGISVPMTRFERAIGAAAARASNLATRLRAVSSSVTDVTRRALNLRSHFEGVSRAVRNIPGRIRQIRLGGIINQTQRVGRGFGSVSRGIGGLISGMARLGGSVASSVTSGFSKMASGAASALGKFSKLDDTVRIVIVVFLLLAPILGLVGSLLAGIPSLIAAIGAPIAAVVAGMDGIKKAAEVLGPSLERIKANVSAAFESRLTPIFTQLTKLTPIVSDGLNKVAVGLSEMAGSFTNVVTSARGMEQIENILDGVGQFLSDLQPMVGGFTQGFLTLAEAGAQSFGLLSQVLNDFGLKFNEISQNLVASGAFESSMQGLAQVTDALLQSFLKLFDAGARIMGTVAGPLSAFITAFTDAIVALMPTLAGLSDLIFSTLAGALNALAPAFQAIGEALGPILTALGETLRAALEALTPVLTVVGQILGEVLVQAFNALAPVLPVIVDMLTILATTVGQALMEVFQAIAPLLPILADAFVQILNAVAPLLPLLAQLAGEILMALVQALTPLVPAFQELIEAVLPIVIDLIRQLAPVIMLAVQALIELLPPLIAFIGEVLNRAMPIIQGLADLIGQVFPYIQDIISAAMTIIQGIINLAMGIIQGDWGRAWEGVKQIFSGAWELVKSVIQAGIAAVVGFFTELGPKILGALGDLGSLLYEQGKAIIQGLWDGLKALWESVKGWVSGIADWISANKGPISKDRKLLIPAGRAIMQGLRRGLQAGFSTVQDDVTTMGDRLASSIRGTKLGEELASSIAAGGPQATRAMDRLMAHADGMNTEWRSEVEGEGFGSVAEKVSEALRGWGVQIDANGVAKLVNKSNARRSRRR